MKNEELIIPVEKKAEAADESSDSATNAENDQPRWLKSIRGAVKLVHEVFATIRTGILPILLFFFLFAPSILSSGLSVFTDHLAIILDKMAANGQDFTFDGTKMSLTNTQRKVFGEILAKPLSVNKDGTTTLTEEQLKTVGAGLEEKKRESPDDNKLIDAMNNKVVDALSSIPKATTTAVEGWLYLGKAKDDNTWEKAETINSKINIQDLKPNGALTLTDGTYLRAEAPNCQRATGSIITAIPVGETVTIVSAPDTCAAMKTVWIKVKRNL